MVLMIVSGRSGSGKSVALRALEDMGFYCVDNMPPKLLPKFAECCYPIWLELWPIERFLPPSALMFVICRSHQKYSNRR